LFFKHRVCRTRIQHSAERSRESVTRLKAITQCFPGLLKPFIGTNLPLLSDPGVCVCVAILQTHLLLLIPAAYAIGQLKRLPHHLQYYNLISKQYVMYDNIDYLISKVIMHVCYL